MAAFDSSPTPVASYANRPHASITLPRNFAPLGFDASDPKTPDQTFSELNLPPPPQHNTLHGRRPPINFASFQAQNAALAPTLFASEIPVPSSANPVQSNFTLSSDPISSDEPLPSIEAPTIFGRPLFQHSITDPSPSERLRLPTYREQPPRTPPAQTKTTPAEVKRSIWDMHRSESECSFRSDSSPSSADTFTTRPTSFDGSTTSPDLDSCDPFSPHKVNIIPDTPTRRSKKIRTDHELSKEKVQWSIEMDNHLFNVYQMYLADPSLTPFKAVPGSIPPTGVCHRVARRAKQTWPKASRITRPIVRRYKLRNVFEGRGIPRDKTPEPNDFLKTDNRDQKDSWPSESATRKRLKQLCKEKFTITAHYQRLRQSRSPSPFTDQFLRRPSPRITGSMSNHLANERAATNYTTRELGISLVATGATAPLAQLVTGDSPPSEQQSDIWFNAPLDSTSERMNTSSPSGLGILAEPERLSVAASNIPRLASPFSYSTWNGQSRANSQHRRYISQNQFDTIHATGSRLLSPFKPEPDVSSNVNKRRAQHNLEDELSPQGSNLAGPSTKLAGPVQLPQELVFSGEGDLSQRRIRLRGRGATMGAVNTRERIQGLFHPPTLQTPIAAFASDIPPVPPLSPSLSALFATTNAVGSSGLAPPELDPTQKRLGSPFELDPNKRSYRQTSPRHVPSLSDPFIGHQSSAMSIGQRLEEFTNLHRQRHDDPFA